MQTYAADENDFLQEDYGTQAIADQMRWLTIPIYTGLVLLGVLMVLNVRDNFFGIALAYINIWLFMWAILYFSKKQQIEFLIPVLSLPNQLFAWPVAMVYFAIFNPSAYYATWEGSVSTPFVSGATRVQLATLLFWIGYFPVVRLATRGTGEMRPIRNPAFVAACVAIFGMTILVVNGISKIIVFPESITYVLDGLLKYFNGILLVVGALFTYLSKKMKIMLAIFFPAMILFYTIANARGLAVIPTIFFFAGILLLSGISTKIKLIILLSLFVLLPIYVVVGNVTRVLGGGVGFEDLSYRLQLLKEWRYVFSQSSPLTSTMGRLFYSGGHAIITQTPESHPFLDFSIFGYIKELLLRLLPGTIWFNPYYSHYLILRDYGFRIMPGKSTVEVSMLGNLWLLGGFKAVFLGGIAVGVFHSFVIKFLRRSSERSQLKALLYLGALAPMLMYTTGRAFIDMCRDYIWALIFGFLIWLILCTIAGENSSEPDVEYNSIKEEGTKL
jgi:hypothetical protein